MGEQLIPVAGLFLFVNTCMYAVVLCIGGWAINTTIDHTYTIEIHDHSPMYFSMGNAATGPFVMFAMIAGAFGVASTITGINHLHCWNINSLSVVASAATIAWTLTLLTTWMGCEEIKLRDRNALLRTMEGLMIILSATQLFYIASIHEAASSRRI